MKSLTRAIIDRSALKHNYKSFRSLIPLNTLMMGVVKADAYGHGAIEVSKIALANGCTSLAVARISEVVNLRSAGINAPILLFGYCLPTQVEYMILNNVTASVSSFSSAEILSSVALVHGGKLKVHIKVETGMGRLGINKEIQKDIVKIAMLPGLEVEGVYTHFANADSADKSHANIQFSIFSDILDYIKTQGIELKYRHASNSAATIDMPETHLDLVRPGISGYGLYPSKHVNKNILDLKPALSLKSTVIQIKDVPKGHAISYGSTYITPKATKIAVVPIGYADGFNRLLSSNGSMIINGIKAPIVGRVCMDLTMVDIGNIDNVNIEDNVTVIGTDGESTITADDIADSLNTINYEITSSLTSRVEREYRN